MTVKTREHLIREIKQLDDTSAFQLDEYIRFLKYQARVKKTPARVDSRIGKLYRACAGSDRALAEEGMADYAGALAREDV